MKEIIKRRKVKSQKEMSGPVMTIPVLFFRPSMAAGLAAASSIRPLRDAGVFWRTLAPVMVTISGLFRRNKSCWRFEFKVRT